VEEAAELYLFDFRRQANDLVHDEEGTHKAGEPVSNKTWKF